MTREPTRTRRGVGSARGKRISRARRCTRKKLVAIALEEVPLNPRDIAHAKNEVPPVRQEVARAPGISRSVGRTSRSRVGRSRSTRKKEQAQFERMLCGRGLSRFQQKMTQTRQKTAITSRVTARFDPARANVVWGRSLPHRGSSRLGRGRARSHRMGDAIASRGGAIALSEDALALGEDALGLDEDALTSEEDAPAPREEAIASNGGVVRPLQAVL